jgi:hypothetical protein
MFAVIFIRFAVLTPCSILIVSNMAFLNLLLTVDTRAICSVFKVVKSRKIFHDKSDRLMWLISS